MPRTLNRLSPRTVATLRERGYYADGGGLYLQISAIGTKSWVFRFARGGRQREMGLGPVHTVTLAEAREKALECRKQLLNGVDPIEARRETRAAEAFAKAKTMTFRQCAEAYIESMRAGWKNAKHASQWENTLATYAYPHLGSLSVALIDTGLVLKALEPIWKTKPETASRLRGRIESVFDWATTHKYRHGENPAQWKGRLDNLLPEKSKVAKVRHHPALPYAEIGSFFAALRQQGGIAARALEFTILTAVRTNETIGATWREFDLKAGIWTIPAERMKAEKEHRVPLSGRAIELLKEVLPLKPDEDEGAAPVFPSPKGKALSNMALLAVLKRMGREGLTVHGFRSTFRDWAGETTAYLREVIEHAMAHQLPDKAEAAYARGTLFDKRRRLMADWADYCNKVQPSKADNIVPINTAA
jgi:integrase